jgi:hypothetical protein
MTKPGPVPWRETPPEVHKLFDDAYDLASSREWIPPHVAMDCALVSNGFDPADPGLQGVRLASPLVDAQVRITRRYELIRALAKANLPMTICGAGWESEAYRFKRTRFEGAVPVSRAVELMRSSRLVLSTNGNFGAGAHERPLSALLAGAAAFSDRSRFYEEAFVPEREIMLFDWSDVPDAVSRVAALRDDPESLFSVAVAGKRRVLAEHTWDQRVGDVLRAAGLS